ncbi:MAG: Hsp20/alpha crystallin family protein [Candidatus Krumholzibacteriota bacterium]|nr:Hsp20/alpha crystallin family protein [Candidatus Krumholzibacteriota bacterium]
MTLVKWKPQSNTMLSEFDRLWSDFFGGTHCPESCDWSPRVDIVETNKSFELMVEVPGLDKNDIRLKVDDQVLIMSGERKSEDEKEGRNYRRVERFYGKFERRFRLPSEAELDKIEAAYTNGVLTITVPKSEKVAGREIQVK